jgi:hypothetical protein
LALEPTRYGRPPWPDTAQVYHAVSGQGALPPRSAQLYVRRHTTLPTIYRLPLHSLGMDSPALRITACVIAGSLVAMFCYRMWARWLPKGRNGKSPAALVLEYRLATRLSTLAIASGLLATFALYELGGYPHTDWRPLGIGMGLGLAAPLVILPLVARLRGGVPGEAYVAYALAQKTPIMILYPLLMLGVPLSLFSLVALL